MDYLGVFRAKVGRLRVEIAEIQELNQQFWRDGRNGVTAGMEPLFKSRTDREVNDYKRSSMSLGNSPVAAAELF